MIAPDRASTVLDDRAGHFARHYNRRSFAFEHGLGDHPLFTIPALVELSQRLPDGGASAYWSNGRVAVNDGWEAGQTARATLTETIADIAVNDSLVILKHVNDDPEYGVVLEAFLKRVVELSGVEMRRDVIVGEALVLISSPGRITSYHIDGETNFVVQIAGDKTLSVYDAEDRTLLTDDELERYYCGDTSAARYKPGRDDDAVRYHLRAGVGVHVPLTAPHWAKVGDEVSVALSITYEIRSAERVASIYRCNRRLRALGFRPAPPGTSRVGDAAKVSLMRGIRAVRGKPTSNAGAPA